ncbi:MAG: hypothetical protein AAFW74_01915 [Pseudomonadota bacterium]
MKQVKIFNSAALNNLFDDARFGSWISFPELESWVYEYHLHCGSELTDSDKLAIRLMKGNVKPFVEEVLPSYQLARKLGFETREFCFPNDSLPRDLIVRNPLDVSDLKAVEVTYVGHDYDDALRMELLTKEGSAPAFGPISRDKKTGTIIAKGRARMVSSAIEKRVAQIHSSIVSKEKRGYDKGMWLLVACDAYDFPSNENLDSLVSQIKFPVTDFERIFVLLYGTKGRYLWKMM